MTKKKKIKMRRITSNTRRFLSKEIAECQQIMSRAIAKSCFLGERLMGCEARYGEIPMKIINENEITSTFDCQNSIHSDSNDYNHVYKLICTRRRWNYLMAVIYTDMVEQTHSWILKYYIITNVFE